MAGASFRDFDANGDGIISREEYARGLRNLQQPAQALMPSPEKSSSSDPERAKLMDSSEGEDEDGSRSDGSSDSPGFVHRSVNRACRSGRGYLGMTIVKWIMPMVLWAASTLISMWLLHVATFYYVHVMDRMERAYTFNPDYKEHVAFLSPGLQPQDVSYGSLQDPIEAQLGFKDVPLKALDGVAAFFPCLWGIMVLGLLNLQAWTKILLCNAALAIGKGAFAAMTIVPDSIGWANCKARLGPTALNFFLHEVPDPSEHGALSTWMSILGAEILGPHQNRLGSGMRFCADMVYSGHTYFTILYILAFLELVRMETKKPDSCIFIASRCKRKTLLWVLYVFCIAEQCLEISLVIQNRFHYTLDVALAVMMALLWYTSAPICIAAKWWAAFATRTGDYRMMEPDELELAKAAQEKGFALVPREALQSEGDLWLPVFCVPFCCLHGRHHIVSDSSFRYWATDIEPGQESGDDVVRKSSRAQGLIYYSQ